MAVRTARILTSMAMIRRAGYRRLRVAVEPRVDGEAVPCGKRVGASTTLPHVPQNFVPTSSGVAQFVQILAVGSSLISLSDCGQFVWECFAALPTGLCWSGVARAVGFTRSKLRLGAQLRPTGRCNENKNHRSVLSTSARHPTSVITSTGRPTPTIPKPKRCKAEVQLLWFRNCIRAPAGGDARRTAGRGLFSFPPYGRCGEGREQGTKGARGGGARGGGARARASLLCLGWGFSVRGGPIVRRSTRSRGAVYPGPHRSPIRSRTRGGRSISGRRAFFLTGSGGLPAPESSTRMRAPVMFPATVLLMRAGAMSSACRLTGELMESRRRVAPRPGGVLRLLDTGATRLRPRRFPPRLRGSVVSSPIAPPPL